jgi:glutaconate CoA-transferase, subunit B
MVAAVTTDGVTLVVTDLCLLAPDPESKELVVTSLHPGVEASEVRAATAWPIRFARRVEVTPMPTPSELDALHSLERRTADARARGHG